MLLGDTEVEVAEGELDAWRDQRRERLVPEFAEQVVGRDAHVFEADGPARRQPLSQCIPVAEISDAVAVVVQHDEQHLTVALAAAHECGRQHDVAGRGTGREALETVESIPLAVDGQFEVGVGRVHGVAPHPSALCGLAVPSLLHRRVGCEADVARVDVVVRENLGDRRIGARQDADDEEGRLPVRTATPELGRLQKRHQPRLAEQVELDRRVLIRSVALQRIALELGGDALGDAAPVRAFFGIRRSRPSAAVGGLCDDAHRAPSFSVSSVRSSSSAGAEAAAASTSGPPSVPSRADAPPS